MAPTHLTHWCFQTPLPQPTVCVFLTTIHGEGKGQGACNWWNVRVPNHHRLKFDIVVSCMVPVADNQPTSLPSNSYPPLEFVHLEWEPSWDLAHPSTLPYGQAWTPLLLDVPIHFKSDKRGEVVDSRGQASIHLDSLAIEAISSCVDTSGHDLLVQYDYYI